MIIFAVLLVASLVLSSPSIAQQLTAAELKARAAEAEMQRQDLVNLELETARALQLNSTAFFKRVYSDDFVGTAPLGQLMDKSAMITAVATSPAKYTTFVASDIRVRLYEETAVVTSLWTERGMLSGRKFSRQSRVTHVYVNGPRGWQVVSSQETPLAGVGE